MLGIAARKRRGYAADARGRRVTLAGVDEVRRVVRERGWGREHRRLVREATPSWVGRVVGTAVLTWGLAGVALLGQTVADIAGWAMVESVLGAVFVVALGVAVLLTAVTLVVGLARSGRETALVMTRLGVCPVCLYELSGTPRGEGGVVVCPECGGAWRIGAGGEGTGGA